MNRNGNFLSLLTIMIVAISVPVTLIILQSGNLDLRIQAFDNPTPQNVTITNVKDTSFHVAWITEKETQGGIKLSGVSTAPILEEKKSSYHSLEVKGLQANTDYSFKIISDGQEYEQTPSGAYTAKTAAIASGAGNHFVYAQVFAEDGITFQQSGLVHVQFTKNGLRSQKISAVLNEAGGFQVNLFGMLNEAHAAIYDYNGDITLNVNVFLVGKEEPIIKRYTVNVLSSRQLPNIYLGDVKFDTIPGIDGL